MADDKPTVTVGIFRETYPGEDRVALVPPSVKKLGKSGLRVVVQSGAGQAAGYSDAAYTESGAEIVSDGAAVIDAADIVLRARAAGANKAQWAEEIECFREGQTLIGMCDPLGEPDAMQQLADRGINCFAMELLPRTTRAQSMDILSSMASISGYKAVLLAAQTLPRLFPMMMTAAGTITPARVFVIGAGVAGLQAISSARRLGAVVHAYDIRPAVKEEALSLGAKFVELGLEADETSPSSGQYAREMDEAFYRRQREVMQKTIAASDVLITTAAVPGKKAPTLVTAGMVEAMPYGSVIVDLAAEQGGNCELTRPNETVIEHGVTIIGCVNLPSTVPFHASLMLSNNLTDFLLHLVQDGVMSLDRDDEILSGTLVTRGKEVVNARVREALQLPALTNGVDTPTTDSDVESSDKQGDD